MRKRDAQDESKSLKTVLIYTGIVLFFILLSLLIKAIFVFQQSKYDGQHVFTLVIANNNKIGEIVSFDPTGSSLSLLKISDSSLPISSYGKVLAVAGDAVIDGKGDIPLGTDVAGTLTYLIFHFNDIKTNITLYDIGRLLLIAKNVSETDKKVKEISLPILDIEQDKIVTSLFTDYDISSENISIQIINATNVSGIGKRLERMLTNIGANVVSVTTASTTEKSSKILYSNKESYTLDKMKKILHYPVSKTADKSVANITIIIGEDSINTSLF